LEARLKSGASPLVTNEEGLHPLRLVATLIKKSFEDGNFGEEDLYKKMAAVLIVHGAPCDDLKHACGEISNLCRYICGYIVERSTKMRDSGRVVELIREGRIWFEKDDKDVEKRFLDAVEKGDRETVDSLFENGEIHYAYEQ
jgi:hypothetical protein